MIKRAILILAGCVSLAVPGAVASAQGAIPQEVLVLANRIRATISALPPDSKAAAYQAQIVSTVQGDGSSCEIVREALLQNYGGGQEAQAAIGRLRAAFARCSGATGAISNGGAGGFRSFSGVGFSVGGGSSNYVN